MDERTSVRLTWSLGAVAAVLLVEAVAASVQVAGAFNAAALQKYSEPMNWLIHRTMIDSVRARARNIDPPRSFSRADAVAGFRIYDRRCVMCHGGPGVGRQGWVAGMHPAPPYLVDASAHWQARELYYIISDGVKMTGMPAWSPTLSQAQRWSLVAFLEAMPHLTASDYARLRLNDAPR